MRSSKEFQPATLTIDDTRVRPLCGLVYLRINGPQPLAARIASLVPPEYSRKIDFRIAADRSVDLDMLVPVGVIARCELAIWAYNAGYIHFSAPPDTGTILKWTGTWKGKK